MKVDLLGSIEVTASAAIVIAAFSLNRPDSELEQRAQIGSFARTEQKKELIGGPSNTIECQ
jgi:hypothetical protein